LCHSLLLREQFAAGSKKEKVKSKKTENHAAIARHFAFLLFTFELMCVLPPSIPTVEVSDTTTASQSCKSRLKKKLPM